VRYAEVFGPLADRPFRLLWLAASASAVGSAFIPVALAFAILDSGGTAVSLGVVLLASMIAGLAAYLAAGVWADRLARRNLMLAADLVRLGAQATMATLLLIGSARIWQLALASVITAIASSFDRPASTGLVAEIVPAGKLQKANSLLSISTSAASVAGPALSGLVVAVAGPGWSFAVDATSFAASAMCLGAMGASAATTRQAQRRFASELAEGWRELAARSWYWLNLAAHALCNLAFASFLVLGPVLAARRPGGASGWGLVLSGLSAGSLVGGLVAMWVRTRRPLVFANLALMLWALPMLALAARLPLYLLVACAVIGMSGAVILNTNWATVIQQLIPNDVLARVRSFDYVLAFIAMPAGYALAGPLSVVFGAAKVLAGGAALIALSVATTAALPAVRAITRQADGHITGRGRDARDSILLRRDK
jgi:MFS family permease